MCFNKKKVLEKLDYYPIIKALLIGIRYQLGMKRRYYKIIII